MTFTYVIRPRAQNQHSPSSTSIKEDIGGFVIIAKTIVGKQDEGVLLVYQHLHHLLLLRRDEWRHHHHTLASLEHATIHIVPKCLTVTVLSCFHPDVAHMHHIIVLGMQQGHIAHAVKTATNNLDVLLHPEEARHQALRSQPLRVHLHIMHHRSQLTAA